MPLNTLRLNHAPSSHPNDRIVFIKPLPRPPPLATDYQTADTLLRAIAAQCLPIMKSHYLSVTTLEEHEPNPEFIGRNFNNGEIIQLVLRSKNGGWLPVNMIQMVMMHELAHNVHMNHSRKFWETRNMFAGEMRALWAKGYTGEGLWGNGRTLNELGNIVGSNFVRSEELKDLPVCGGTFRSRVKKRKSKTDGLTWKEKKERRIEKKFGKNGVALGEDEDKRLSLELNSKGPIGVKPRVAQSKRGRELRVAAALARFDTNKKEVEELETVKTEDEQTQSEDDYEDADVGQEDARDRYGRRLLDSKGQGMIKVCEEEDCNDVNVKREMDELENLETILEPSPESEAYLGSTSKAKSCNKPQSLYDIPQHQDESAPKKAPPRPNTKSNPKTQPKITIHRSQPSASISSLNTTPTNSSPSPTRPITPEAKAHPTSSITVPNPNTTACPICSLSNPSLQPTCLACSHVLDRRKDPRSWKCQTGTCTDSEYVNSGDVNICGVCGVRKST